MAIQTINIGTVANDGTGDDLREAFVKVNANFAELAARNPEQTTGANLGASGEGVFAQLNGAEMQFKKLIGGGNVTLTSDGNAITVNSVGGLQTLTVETDNGSQTVTDGDTLKFIGGTNLNTKIAGGGVTLDSVTELSSDLTPQLGANLDGQNNNIINVNNINAKVWYKDIRDIAGFNFGTITKSYNDMFAWLLDNQDIEFGLIDQPGLQDDSTVSIRLVDLGTISNPL
ncbi:MAG: hypothetical protein CMM91_05695 [Rickettsiales bacterium]|nr:hypothetical protein [Rickettsiales bacterium]|tara:strand:- start:457 stop:1143 length:687 start_codon:yes stop_codon:yes gene_type:complete